MGLDMYIYRTRYVSAGNDANMLASLVDLPTGKAVQVKTEVAYWRRAYSVYDWILNELGNNLNNGEEREIDPEMLTDLRDDCKGALENPDKEDEFLLRRAGESDDEYRAHLERTISMIDEILERGTDDTLIFCASY